MNKIAEALVNKAYEDHLFNQLCNLQRGFLGVQEIDERFTRLVCTLEGQKEALAELKKQMDPELLEEVRQSLPF